MFVRLYALSLLVGLSACADLGFVDDGSDADPIAPALAQCQANFGSLQKRQGRSEQELKEIRSELLKLSEQMTSANQRCVETQAQPIEEPEDGGSVLANTEGKLVVGSRERIWVEALQLSLSARIDTGAETASLDARNVKTFERNGRPWVSFEIPDPDSEEPIQLERRRVREALVVQANAEEPERRPVIRLGIQLGPIRQLAEVTLTDRSNLDFLMLVGRIILRDVLLVDVCQNNLVPLPKGVKESQSSAP